MLTLCLMLSGTYYANIMLDAFRYLYIMLNIMPAYNRPAYMGLPAAEPCDE